MKKMIKVKAILKKIIPPLFSRIIKTDINLIIENSNKKKNQKKLIAIVKMKESCNDPIWLELGSDKPRINWTTIDLSKTADICFNLTSNFPLNDETIDILYSSHLFEHFHYSELLKLLKELRRILKFEGVLKVCVPDAKIFLDAFQNNNENLIRDLTKLNHFEHPVTRIDLVNFIAYMGNSHKFMFTKENLIAILMHVGFKNVTEREYDPEIDLEVRKDESIYIIAYK